MKLLTKILRNHAGQALPLALILMVVGVMIIIPTLSLATTNLKATHTVDQKTQEAYAADAGIEDALWHLQSDERMELINPTNSWPVEYELVDPVNERPVNERNVEVNIDRAWLLNADLGSNLPASIEAAEAMSANDHWVVISAINIDDTTNYIMDISTDEAADAVYVDHIGVWLPPGYSYVDDSVEINGVAIGGDALLKNPDDQLSHRGGTALIWDYWGTSFESLSDIAPPPPEGGVTPADKFPPSMRLSFNYTSTPFQEARGFFPWINLSTGNRLAWDTDSGFYHVESTGITPETETSTTVEAYVPTSVKRYVSGDSGASSSIQGDYIAIGNSLMTSCWYKASYWSPIVLGPPCSYNCSWQCRGTQFNQSSATVNASAVPLDAQIEKTYLYWTAWWWDNDADTQATLQVNGTAVGAGGTVAADTWYILPTPAVNGYQYACFADVTDQVKAITTTVNGTEFTVGDIDAVPASTCSSSSLWLQATNAGWSMIIIYSSQETEVHQIYLYDQLAYLRDPSGAHAEFTILGFQAPQEGNRDAKLAVFAAEGDAQISPTHVMFQGQHSASYIYLGDLLSIDPNYYDNVFNSYSTATGFTPSQLDGQPAGKISGVDIDIYTEDKDGNSLSNIVQPGDILAKVRVETYSDGFMLVYVVFSIRSAAVTAGTEFDVGTMMYQFK